LLHLFDRYTYDMYVQGMALIVMWLPSNGQMADTI